MSAYGEFRLALAREFLAGEIAADEMARRLDVAATEYPGFADELRREAAGYRCQRPGRREPGQETE